MSYILSLLIAAGVGSAKASGQGSEPGFGEAQPEAWPPFTVNFQGHLRQGTTIINGTYQMTFRLYNAASGGTLLQTMGPWNVNVSSGVFNVELPITQANILNYTNLWIEVDIPALGGIYTPRVKINSAAFAYNAFMSDSTQRIRNKGVTPEDLNMSAAAPNQANNFDLDANGRIDLALLDVPASGTDPGYIWNQYSSAQTPGRFWISDSGRAGSGAKYGLLNATNYGVYGQYNASNYGYLGGNGYGGYGYGSTYGMYGRYSAANNYGYLGSASYGVYGYYNTGRYGYLGSASYGVYGYYDASNYGYLGGNGTGAFGYTNTAAYGNSNAGVIGLNPHNQGIAVLGVGQNVTATPPSTGAGVMGASDTFGIYGIAINSALAGAGIMGVGPGWSGWAYPGNGAGVSGVGYTGVYGYSNTTPTTGSGVRGFSAHANGVGVIGAGNNLTPTVPTYGCGVAGTGDTVGTFGYATLAGGIGVWGQGANASSNGVYGVSPGTNGWAAVEGFANAANGIGAYFVGNNQTVGGIYFNDGGGVYGYDLNQGVCGLAYDQSTGPSEPGGIGAMCFGNTQTLSGYWAPTRGAGVSGYGEYLGVWGAEDVTATPTAPGSYGILGYYAGTSTGVFGWASNAASYWAGYFDGPGTEGDVNITGDLYLDGTIVYYKSGGKDDDYIPGLIATVPADGESPLYAMYASDAKIYFDGQGRLKNGEAFIKIPEDIAKVIAGNAQVVVTPVGSWSGIYVAEIRSDGFLVKSGAGDPNAEFKWIAVAERKGTEGGKADVLVAQKLEKLSQKVTPPAFITKTSVRRPDKTFRTSLVSDHVTVNANIQRAPADAEELKEVR